MLTIIHYCHLKLNVKKSIESRKLVFDNQVSYKEIIKSELLVLYALIGSMIFQGIVISYLILKGKFSVYFLFMAVPLLFIGIVILYRTAQIAKLSKLKTYKRKDEIRNDFLRYAKENAISISSVGTKSMIFTQKTEKTFGSITYTYIILWIDFEVYYSAIKVQENTIIRIRPVFLRQYELRNVIRKTLN